ncbi:hypothetical protein [Amycolatopsis sp. lyj-23]|uniref:hypothetical protein n=1 Tax=Amycolatopsis sp. lyj-23 TaxID=2789283 RepID=UPI003979DB9E
MTETQHPEGVLAPQPSDLPRMGRGVVWSVITAEIEVEVGAQSAAPPHESGAAWVPEPPDVVDPFQWRWPGRPIGSTYHPYQMPQPE